jgi:hypothetical protein
MQSNRARGPREKRTSIDVVALSNNNSQHKQIVMTLPARLRKRGNFPADAGDELEVVEVQDRNGNCRLELVPVDD